jgi:4-hydroxythreonine-4-phosphate dehydrogenase
MNQRPYLLKQREIIAEGEIRVGITHGDINGIGYEVIMKTMVEEGILNHFVPIIYGTSKIASYHRKTLTIPDLPFNHIRRATQAQKHKFNIVNITDKEVKVNLGQSTQEAGELAALALQQACRDLEEGLIDVLVTAPINKHNIQSESFQFPGHTEYLAHRFNACCPLMLMVAGNLRIGTITGHLPLRKVADAINEELIINKIKVTEQSLIQDFGITKPRIAVLSLNPHAGDQGLLGDEDEKIVAPAIQKAFEDGYLVFGPYPADGFFGSGEFRQFDAILSTYHDQGLTPFKLLAEGRGVNFTAGLPIVRTSPAHGTAYEIAGKDQTSSLSMREAIFLAIAIYHNRLQYAEMTANPLRKSKEGEAATQEEDRP